MRAFKLLSFLAILLVSSVSVTAQSTDEFNLDKEYALGENGTISLNSDDADVIIRGSDRSNVRLVVYYKLEAKGITFGKKEKFEMLVDEEGGNLNIYENEREIGNRVIIGSSREEYRITIEAPRGANLNLRGDDEDYQISGIDGSLAIKADDSDAELTDCNGNDFWFEMDDGNLRMDGGTGKLHLNIDDGDVRISNGDFSELNVDFDDSDIEISTGLDDEGTYRFDFDDGDLRLNIAGGGGEFDISHDDADISADSEFERILNEEDRSIYRLRGGNARVTIITDDGDIIFRVI